MIRRMSGGLLATLLLLLSSISGSALTLNRDESGSIGGNNVAGTEAVGGVLAIQQAQNVALQAKQNLTGKDESSLLSREQTTVCLNSEVVKRNTEYKSLLHDPNLAVGYLVIITKKSPNLARSGPGGEVIADQKNTSG
jgi:hypothetical protein